jgi:hypothetical protein
MKNLAICISFLCLLAISCKKKDTTSTVTTTTASPYYFKFTLDGTSNNYNSALPQYMPFYANEIGGYEVANANLFPAVGLRLSWPIGDTVKESDVMALIGKTLYFSDTLIHPQLSYDLNTSGTVWYSADTANTDYNVKITNVTYLKKDTTLGYAVRTYVITGTCSGVLSQGTTYSILSGGSFNFIISRRDL